MQLFEFHEIPNDHIIFETNISFVFVNLRPFLKNHILVSPKRIVSRVKDLNAEEMIDLFKTVQFTTKVLSEIYDGFTINIQDGKEAGQTVFHVHVHIVPRKKNDLKNNNEIYKEGSLDCIRENRDYNEMKEEAEYLKRLFNVYLMADNPTI